MRSEHPVGARLAEAAALARTPWLMFLRSGCVPEPTWVDAVRDFIGTRWPGREFSRPGARVFLRGCFRGVSGQTRGC
jgi:hypothetical protein